MTDLEMKTTEELFEEIDKRFQHCLLIASGPLPGNGLSGKLACYYNGPIFPALGLAEHWAFRAKMDDNFGPEFEK